MTSAPMEVQPAAPVTAAPAVLAPASSLTSMPSSA
jgi:hypothetical protein